ncbi:MAG: nucleoside phosphorylase [Thermodesulfobacteriota bacterium]
MRQKIPPQRPVDGVDFSRVQRPDPVFFCSAGIFNDDQDVLIHPVREPGEGAVSPTVILTCAQPDYQALCRLAQVRDHPRRLWGCAYRPGSWEGASLTVVAPALGAPFAAMILEKLIALGARRVLALGWCGSVAPRVRIGDLILPTSALPGDGTSPHYCRDQAEIIPHQGLYDLLAARLEGLEVPWQAGPVWSTDAFYRETKGLIRSCQAQGVLGIDLELAALFAVGRFRGIAIAALLVVSDELFTSTWQAARGSEPFRRGRQAALRLVLDAAAAAEDQNV